MGAREKTVIGKCYDFTKEHLTECVEGSIMQLNVDYLDVLLLHRPDAREPETIAEVFNAHRESSKVKYFGVSNHNPSPFINKNTIP